MKILLISPLPPPNGGIGTWTKKYLAFCNDYDIEADIVNTAPIGRRGIQLNIKRSIKDEIVRTYRIFSELKRKLKSKKYDVVHLNTSCDKYGLYRDYFILRIIKKNKKKAVVHFRCNLTFQIDTSTRQKIFAEIAKYSDRMLALNNISLEFARKYDYNKAQIIPNYIEEEYLNENFCVRDRIKRIVFVGHVQFVKGFREIYAAARQFPDIEFELIGPVRDEVKNFEKLSNLVFKGELAHDEIRTELCTADVFLFPSYTEGFANALLEAMACGLPIIASDVGANADMIENKGGRIVQKESTDEIIRAIYEMNSPKIRRQMSGWNIAKVKSNYLVPAVMSRLYGIYLEVKEVNC